MNTICLSGVRTPALAWRSTLIAIGVYVAAVLLGYWPTWRAMVDTWSRSESYTHAFVVPPIVAWLIWRQRARLSDLEPRPVPWLVLAGVATAGLWALGSLVAVHAASQFAVVALLVLGVPMLAGWAVARALAFPLAFLFFAVPFGDFLTPYLMVWTADFTVAALRVTGIPVFREGQQFVIPSGHWSVVEACSGIRYLMASFMVGSLFAYLNYRSLGRRLVFCAMSILVPVLANWLRAYIIVMLGHLSNNRIATGVDHIVYGWVFFGVVITTLFFVGARWAQDDGPAAGRVERSAPPAQTAAWWPWVVALSGALMVQWPSHWTVAERPPLAEDSRLNLPAELSPAWLSTGQGLTEWRPVYVGAASEVEQVYAGHAGRVGVHIAYYRRTGQQPNRLISSVNMLVPPESPTWNLLPSEARTIDGHTWSVNRLLPHDGAGRHDRPGLMVWRAHWIGGHWTTSAVEAKLWQAWLQLRAQPDDSADVVLFVETGTDRRPEALLSGFVQDNLVNIERQLTLANDR